MAYKLEPIDQSQFEKALEEAKKQMSETNKMITLAS